MGLWDKLRHASDYLRKLRLSLGPDSYFQYNEGGKTSASKQTTPVSAQGSPPSWSVKRQGAKVSTKSAMREREVDAGRERTGRAESDR
jgi:hypothetical protein